MFFVRCASHHRDRHSFPTRRSSDLIAMSPRFSLSGPSSGKERTSVALSAPRNCRLSSRIRLSRSEEHTSELQSRGHLVCRLLLEKKKTPPNKLHPICYTATPPRTSI